MLVLVNIYLRSISKIDDVNMEYSSQFTFREEWWDARLAYARFADENTQVPPFVVLATSELTDQSQQIWVRIPKALRCLDYPISDARHVCASNLTHRTD